MNGVKVAVGYFILQLETENASDCLRLQRRFSAFVSSAFEADGVIRFYLTHERNLDPWVEPALTAKPDSWAVSGSGVSGVIGREEVLAEFWVAPNTSMQAVEHLIRIVSAIWIFAHGGLLVHAAGLERNGQGYLFTGPSGAGKSTVCRVSKDALILNDDLVVLRETESELEVWATPFSNPKQNKPNPGTAKLRSVFILCQAEFHKVEPENAAIALADLISKTPIVAVFPENMKILLERCQRFLSHVKVYRLHFLPDDQFWRIIPE